MARKVSVAIPTTARKAAAAKVAALRAERAARRRAKRPELAARFDRLRAELELRRQEIARIQRDLGRDIRVAVAATAEDRKLDAKLAAASAEDPAIARVAAGRRPQCFLTKTAKPVDPKELHGLIVAALGLGRYPGLVELKPLYPSLARRRPDLARYLIVELDANRRACRRIAARVADRLRQTGAFTSVRAESLGMQVFSSGGGGTGQGFEMEEPDDRDWHLTSPDDGGVDFRGYRGAIDVYGAWDVLGADAGEDGAEAGAEVVIGHPDTGFREQAEYPAERIDLQNAFNAFLGVTTQPQSVGDPTLNVARHGLTPTGFPYIVQHGTYTASVIVAPKGGNVSGASPGATMLPLRCVDTVILAGDVEVTTAIEHAIDRDVDVISISLGGAPNPALREALAAAVEAGIIVVAAAGQPQGAP
ncbi:MAG: S8 family serine peptidase, partial [Alphaproteobacteria bacterium]